jgi:transposase
VLVAKGYRPVDRDQRFLLPPDMREWLPADHPVWLMISVVSMLDTTKFHRHRRTGGVGRAGYDPDMLLTLLMWGWSQGVRSSRKIESRCLTDVPFRVICAGDVPDHATISRFLAASPAAVEDLFMQVLMLCSSLGMGRLGVVALDGVKIASNASMSANRTEEGLVKAAGQEKARQASKLAAAAAARQAAAEHASADAADQALFGDGDDGGQVPPDAAAGAGGREARIAQALADLRAERAAEQAADERKAQQWLDRLDTHGGRGGRPPAGIAVALAAARVEKLRAERVEFAAQYRARREAAAAAGTGKKLGGRRPVARSSVQVRAEAVLARAQAREAKRRRRADAIRRVRNITDPQSHLMPLRGGGWLQGYNCQAVTSSDGLIIAAAVNNNPSDTITFTTMTAKAVAAAELIDTHRPTSGEPAPAGIGILLADAGYLSDDNLTAPGPDRLIAVGTTRTVNHTAREAPASGAPPEGADPTQAMAHRLATPEGIAAYRQRSHIAETPFGHAKHNWNFRRFTSRGQERANAEWLFHALVNNITKAITAGLITLPSTT